MKQAQNARKQRGRPAQRKGGRSNNSGGGSGNNRPDNRARGNPKQLLEKYKTQARDLLQSGDRVNAEYYLQFADHYQRVLNEMQANQNNRDQQNNQNSAEQQGDQQSNGEGRDDRQPRRGRGRRDHRNRPADSSNQAAEEVKQTEEAKPNQVTSEAPQVDAPVVVDPGVAEQPVEVHPELALGDAAPAEKPKRRAPARRRAAAKPKKAEAAPEAGPQENVASEAAAAPEGGEAA